MIDGRHFRFLPAVLYAVCCSERLYTPTALHGVQTKRTRSSEHVLNSLECKMWRHLSFHRCFIIHLSLILPNNDLSLNIKTILTSTVGHTSKIYTANVYLNYLFSSDSDEHKARCIAVRPSVTLFWTGLATAKLRTVPSLHTTHFQCETTI